MNILFLDDDLQRHYLFHSWVTRVQKQRSRARWFNIFRRASQLPKVEAARVEAAFTVEAAIQSLRDCERFDVAFLGHDLDGRAFIPEREGTGTQVAEWIATMKPEARPRRVVVHSHNPAGARRMADILRERGCLVEA